MPECNYCHQNRNELKNGLCIICQRGPGGNPVEVKKTDGIRYKGKIIKKFDKKDLRKKMGFSTRNHGVWKKEKNNNI